MYSGGSDLREVTCRIRIQHGNNKQQVVHFDHLKPCPHNICRETTVRDNSTPNITTHVGEHLTLGPESDHPPQDVHPAVNPPPRHYPSRVHHSPDCYVETSGVE